MAPYSKIQRIVHDISNKIYETSLRRLSFSYEMPTSVRFCLSYDPLKGFYSPTPQGWFGGAMVLGKPPVPGRPSYLADSRQGPIALAVGAAGGCLDIFILIYLFSPFSPSL